MSRVNILGVPVDLLTEEELFSSIIRSAESPKTTIIGNHNLNSLQFYEKDEAFRRFCDLAQINYVDGMPIIMIARLQGIPASSAHRHAYNVFIYPLARLAAERGWRTYFVGSAPGVAETAFARLQAHAPSLQWRARHGYFDATPGSPDSEAIIADIRRFEPHLLLVGMGMPRQEQWVVQHLDQLEGMTILNCGACMDFVAGKAKVAPPWMSSLSLEWLHRTIGDPLRLGPRYASNAVYVARQLLRTGSRT